MKKLQKDKKAKRQKDEKTKKRKDKKTRDKDQKESLILRRQGSFALLRCLSLCMNTLGNWLFCKIFQSNDENDRLSRCAAVGS